LNDFCFIFALSEENHVKLYYEFDLTCRYVISSLRLVIRQRQGQAKLLMLFGVRIQVREFLARERKNVAAGSSEIGTFTIA
jgi:hypothetical protein